MSYTDSLIIVYCCLSALLHLFEVCILDVFTSLSISSWLCAWLSIALIHLSTYFQNSSV